MWASRIHQKRRKVKVVVAPVCFSAWAVILTLWLVSAQRRKVERATLSKRRSEVLSREIDVVIVGFSACGIRGEGVIRTCVKDGRRSQGRSGCDAYGNTPHVLFRRRNTAKGQLNEKHAQSRRVDCEGRCKD